MRMNRNESTTIKVDHDQKEQDDVLTMENYKQSSLNKLFLAAHILAVVIDPFFFFIPVIDSNRNCLRMDPVLKFVVPAARTVLDFFYIMRLFYLKPHANDTFDLTSSTKSDIAVVITALIPLPQVIIFGLYRTVSCSKNWTKYMRLLDILILFQYVPRIIPIFQSSMELNWSYDSIADRVFIKGAFNFCLYIAASHICGAFWYYFSIQRLKVCWLEYACANDHQHAFKAFICHANSTTNQSLLSLNQTCPLNSPEEKDKFGIFAFAISSNLIGTQTDFMKKYVQSFWWGLRNLSSYGTNLETSSDPWEACLGAIMCLLGLLIFLYLIGNLQTYMQLDSGRSINIKQSLRKREGEIHNMTKNHDQKRAMKDCIRKNIRIILNKEDDKFDFNDLMDLLKDFLADNPNAKVSDLEEKFVEWKKNIADGSIFQEGRKRKSVRKWMEDNHIPNEIRIKIKQTVLCRMEDDVQDVNLVNVLAVLPTRMEETKLLKKHLFQPILRIEKFKDVQDKVVEMVRPVIFEEDKVIISKGEPLDFMCFITQGVMWCYGGEEDDATRNTDVAEQSIVSADDSSTSTSTLAVQPISIEIKGEEYYGKELLEWQLSKNTDPKFPMATYNVKCHTKVEAFVLKAIDLQTLFPGTNKVFPEMSTKSQMPKMIGLLRQHTNLSI